MLAAVDAKLQELGIDRTAYIAGLIAQDLGCNTAALQPQHAIDQSVLQDAIQTALQQALEPIHTEIAELKKPDGAIAA
jgi:hypothetical protein